MEEQYDLPRAHCTPRCSRRQGSQLHRLGPQRCLFHTYHNESVQFWATQSLAGLRTTCTIDPHTTSPQCLVLPITTHEPAVCMSVLLHGAFMFVSLGKRLLVLHFFSVGNVCETALEQDAASFFFSQGFLPCFAHSLSLIHI